MNIIVLTSSRADYSIYLPLLKRMKNDPFFQLKIIAFGTHLSKAHGHTVDEIRKDGLEPAYEINTLPDGDSPEMIALAMGETIKKFAPVWQKESTSADLIICLGDRYEMFAAVAASVPFNIPVAHLHGGETTLGAIDNAFRHSITSMSRYHFVSTSSNGKRVAELTGSGKNIYITGAMGLDNLNDLSLLSKEEFSKKFGITLNSPILVTFHPETIAYNKNEFFADELLAALTETDQQTIITMPNADTGNTVIREKLKSFADEKQNVFAVESLGTVGYFSCIEHCAFLLGNSSSGIIEAASFRKYVINIGDRQKGREAGENVIHCDFDRTAILKAIRSIPTLPALQKENIYGDGKTAEKIISILKTIG